MSFLNRKKPRSSNSPSHYPTSVGLGIVLSLVAKKVIATLWLGEKNINPLWQGNNSNLKKEEGPLPTLAELQISVFDVSETDRARITARTWDVKEIETLQKTSFWKSKDDIVKVTIQWNTGDYSVEVKRGNIDNKIMLIQVWDTIWFLGLKESSTEEESPVYICTPFTQIALMIEKDGSLPHLEFNKIVDKLGIDTTQLLQNAGI